MSARDNSLNLYPYSLQGKYEFTRVCDNDVGNGKLVGPYPNCSYA
jgi:hypothetical protein